MKYSVLMLADGRGEAEGEGGGVSEDGEGAVRHHEGAQAQVVEGADEANPYVAESTILKSALHLPETRRRAAKGTGSWRSQYPST